MNLSNPVSWPWKYSCKLDLSHLLLFFQWVYNFSIHCHHYTCKCLYVCHWTGFLMNYCKDFLYTVRLIFFGKNGRTQDLEKTYTVRKWVKIVTFFSPKICMPCSQNLELFWNYAYYVMAFDKKWHSPFFGKKFSLSQNVSFYANLGWRACIVCSKNPI